MLRVAAALAIVAGVIAGGILAFHRGEPTPVDASNAVMSMNVFSDIAKTQGVNCNMSQLPRKCDVLLHTTFSVDHNNTNITILKCLK